MDANEAAGRGRTVLMLGGGRNQWAGLAAARRLGLRIVLADNVEHPYAARLADAIHVLDLGDAAECLRIAREAAVDGVFSMAADYPVPTWAALCDALGLPGITPAAAHLATDKAAMRGALAAAGVPVPRWTPVSEPSRLTGAAAGHSGAIVVKPARSSGSRGVTRVDAGDRRALERAYARARSAGGAGTVLLEKYVEGPEVSVETLTCCGETRVIAVTDKTTTGAPYFVEVGHAQPSALPDRVQDDLRAVAVAAVAALGIDTGPCHVEIRIGPGGPAVIELGARLGGGFIAAELVPRSTGVDLVEASLRLALGETVQPKPTARGGAALRFLEPEPGVLRAITGVDEARKAPGVVDVQVWCEVGQRIAELTDATARVGYVLAEADDAPTAARLAANGRDRIGIETRRA